MTTDSAWWRDFYDEWLEIALLDGVDDEEIAQTLDFFREHIGIQSGSTVLDQCCGNGRLSLPLAAQGARVIGVDLASRYIAHARDRARDTPAEFHVADAFEYVAPTPCDAVINWWTSFGYAPDDETNALMLQNAWRSLRPHGVFALDFLNAHHVVRHFAPAVVNRCAHDGGELIMIRESTVDLKEGVLHKRWTYVLPNEQRVTHRTRVRLYMPHRIVELLTQTGFVDITLYGGVDASPLTIDSPRCIIVAHRPSEARS